MRVSHISLPLARRWTHGAVPLALALVATLALTACINDYEDDIAIVTNSLRVEMTLATRAADIPTTNGGTNYFENATDEECYINNVHIYLFTYNSDTSQSGDSDDKGTFLAELTETAVGSSSSNTGKCTARGVINKDILANAITSDGTSDLTSVAFRVAVCANWDSYPSDSDLATGTFTIDDLCEYSSTGGTTTDNWSTYSYSGTFTPSATKGIPYFGIQEFTGQNLTGETLDLSASSIYLLRAMARIEVVYDFTDEDDDATDPIGLVVLHHYNATGYCAPKGVYTQSDYYTGSTEITEGADGTSNWTGNYDQGGVHLVGGANDKDEDDGTTVSSRTVTLEKVTGGYTDSSSSSNTHDCWRAYVPEYSNQGNDYAYIQIYWSNEVNESPGELQSDTEHKVYFASYEDGGTTAYDESNTAASEGYYEGRVDIHRNYLYRFFVRPAEDDTNTVTVTVTVQDWTYDTKENIRDEDLSSNGNGDLDVNY